MDATDNSPEVKAFWEALADGRFLVRRCTDCSRAHWYPRGVCPFCFSGGTEWVDGSGRGTIYSYSVMRRVQTPYAIAYVTLEEGPTMMTNIVDCSFDDLRIGQAVRLSIQKRADGLSLPMFTPA
ncbi:MAG: Zn-ribbon domain-containing OB-fold protein [Rhodospirillaceae bacterium]|nr:Zn-ribbon domain-containing OB-fold protein [Rhodospirillaceae bacterium]